MANKKVKSFADELRSAAYIWLGNTNIDNTQLFLTNFNKKIHWIVVENNEDNITLKAPKETNALSQEIFTALYEINSLIKLFYFARFTTLNMSLTSSLLNIDPIIIITDKKK